VGKDKHPYPSKDNKTRSRRAGESFLYSTFPSIFVVDGGSCPLSGETEELSMNVRVQPHGRAGPNQQDESKTNYVNQLLLVSLSSFFFVSCW
jgi:hypothetical protein